jgi:hypothetical protein
MVFRHFLHAFDDAELHTMHDAYQRLCGRLGVRVEDADDPLRIRIARVIVELAQAGIKLEQIETQAMTKLRF